jgi:hypothetical protein
MPLSDNRIAHELERLCRLSFSDFAALALKSSEEARIRWVHAFGNRSDRYRRMTLKPGTGPAGLAVRIGKPVVWVDTGSAEEIAGECPLVAAEKLRAAAAIPIKRGSGIDAVLLVGRRLPASYGLGEVANVEAALSGLIAQLPGSD